MKRLDKMITRHSQQVVAMAIGIAPATLHKVQRGQPVGAATQAKVDAFFRLNNDLRGQKIGAVKRAMKRKNRRPKAVHNRQKGTNKQLLAKTMHLDGDFYLDETFGPDGQILIAAVPADPELVDRVNAVLHGGKVVLHGESKGHNMELERLEQVLPQLLGEQTAQCFWFPAGRLGNMSLSLWYPYVVAILSLVAQMPTRKAATFMLDERGEMTVPAWLVAVAEFINGYLQAQGRAFKVELVAVNSKVNQGVQVADVVASAGARLSVVQLYAAHVALVMFPQLIQQPEFAELPQRFTKWVTAIDR